MKIGVIGGNGVAATNRLCDMIERKVTAAGAFRDAHHPEMIVWQATSVPSRSMFLEGRGQDWRPDYIRIARSFKELGCNVGCMCCNTAHYAVDEIEKQSGLRFINLLEEVVIAARHSNYDKFEILCSDGARKFDLYGKAFHEFAPELKIVYPNDAVQKQVTSVICNVKNRARFLRMDDCESPRHQLGEIIKASSAPVILGCTDLRVAYAPDEKLEERVVVDSLECLSDAIITASKAN